MYIKIYACEKLRIADGSYKGYWTGHSVTLYSKDKKTIKCIKCMSYGTKKRNYPVVFTVKNQYGFIRLNVSKHIYDAYTNLVAQRRKKGYYINESRETRCK